MALVGVLVASAAASAASYGPAPGGVQPAPSGAMSASKTRTVAVVMQEFKFAPNALTLKAGQPVVLRFTNRGKVRHEFVSPDLFHAARSISVSGATLEEGDEVHVAPGATVSIRLTPTRAGTHQFWCAVKRADTGKLHRDLGMRGVITVTR
jgi:uncharacterized cupredoxin-like copper-binding protein